MFLGYSGGSKEHVKRYEDIRVFQQSCGAAAVMLARSAQWNPSIFRQQGMLARDDVIKAYLKYVSVVALLVVMYCYGLGTGLSEQ